MRIIFDIGHPAHVHLFKHLARLLMKNGAEVLFTARDKEFELDLLKAEGFPFVSFGKHYRSLPGKLWGLVKFDVQMFLTGLRFKPDLFISHGTPSRIKVTLRGTPQRHPSRLPQLLLKEMC